METRDNPHSSLVVGEPSSLPSLQPGLGIKPSSFRLGWWRLAPNLPPCEAQ